MTPVEESTVGTIAGKTFQLVIKLEPISRSGGTLKGARNKTGIGARGGRADNEAELQKHAKRWEETHG